MADSIERRDFLKTTAAAAVTAGPAVLSARGQNDKITLGWIGVGTRGNAGIEWLKKAAPDSIHFKAVCDTYQGYIARAKDRVNTVWGNTPQAYNDYRELLADKSIDAVFIMTPEHLHHEMTIAALNAGKHVYIEKPLAHTIEEGWDIIKAWKKSGKVCQVGTQNRSSSLYKRAKELVGQGLIGDVHYVRAFWYRNSNPKEPAWRYVIPADTNESNTDWKRFLGPAPKRPFDKRRYFQWRLYWDYSGGISTDLLVHQTDIVNFMLNKATPASCMASGAIYRWTDQDDDRDTPDTFSAIYEYPGKLQINYSCYFGNVHYGYGEQLMGTEGTIEVLNRQDLYFHPENYKNVPPAVKNKAPIHLNSLKDFQEADGAINHFANFVKAIQGKEKVIAPPDVGQQAAISGHMATLSYKQGKKIIWDDGSSKYRFV
ncbi:MAG TPA: Gfo/Idh/MocA family oxidoreductase [Bryobacteraceae bacterium]|nr:Gfo/Idh/MocA family oxidoreductase [Bryobacteraceae bacterium]